MNIDEVYKRRKQTSLLIKGKSYDQDIDFLLEEINTLKHQQITSELNLKEKQELEELRTQIRNVMDAINCYPPPTAW